MRKMIVYLLLGVLVVGAVVPCYAGQFSKLLINLKHGSYVLLDMRMFDSNKLLKFLNDAWYVAGFDSYIGVQNSKRIYVLSSKEKQITYSIYEAKTRKPLLIVRQDLLAAIERLKQNNKIPNLPPNVKDVVYFGNKDSDTFAYLNMAVFGKKRYAHALINYTFWKQNTRVSVHYNDCTYTFTFVNKMLGFIAKDPTETIVLVNIPIL